MPRGIRKVKGPNHLKLAQDLASLSAKEDIEKVQKLSLLLQKRAEIEQQIEELAGPRVKRGRKPGAKKLGPKPMNVRRGPQGNPVKGKAQAKPKAVESKKERAQRLLKEQDAA